MPEPRSPEGAEVGRHVRPYTITGGRTRHSHHHFTLITLVVTRSSDVSPTSQGPEAAQILELCSARALAVAEIAAHLDLPVSVVKVLCGDLLAAEEIIVQAPPSQSDRPSVELIERVIDGIRQL